MSIYLGNTEIGNGNYLGNLNIRDSNIFMSQSVVVSVDPDAQAFINASGISGSDATAINTLVVALKNTGSLWDKLYVAYPFIGATTSSFKWNLKDTGSYSASFINNPVASTTGIQFNGTSNYLDSNYSIASNVTSSFHISYYKRTGRNTGDNIDMGAFNETTARGIFLASQLTPTLSRARQYATAMDNSAAPYTGSFMVTADTTHSSLYKGSVEKASIALSNPGALTTGSIILGALKKTQDQGVFYYASGSYGFMTIGQHISGSDATNFTTIIQNYQTTLGRQV
jgi:hypothetical protein